MPRSVMKYPIAVVLTILASLGTSSCGSHARGARPGVQLSVIRAAFEHVRARYPEGAVVVDFHFPTVQSPTSLEGPFARRVGARIVAKEDQHLQCDDADAANPVCTFQGAPYLFVAGVPQIVGRDAVVDMIWFQNPKPGLLPGEGWTLRLRRDRGGAWSVVEVLSRSVS